MKFMKMKNANRKLLSLAAVAALVWCGSQAARAQTPTPPRPPRVLTPQERAPKRLRDADDRSFDSASAEKSLPTDAAPVVQLCLASGDVTVRGWDRSEVRARAKDETGLDLRANAAASRVEVVVSPNGRRASEHSPDECNGSSDIELSVPRGATVQLRARSGNVDVRDVAEARIDATSGDVSLERIARAAEVKSLSGDVSLRDARGRARIDAISGSIDVIGVQSLNANDFVSVKSVSGDIRLERLKHARIEAATTSGEVRYTGQLVRGGHYELKTISGDVTVALPKDAACQVNAKVFQSGEIISDFPLKLTNTTNLTRQLIGVIGDQPSADKDYATLSLSSFSGTVRLRRE